MIFNKHNVQIQSISAKIRKPTCTGVAATSDVGFVHYVPEGWPPRPRIVLSGTREMGNSAHNTAKKKS